MTIGDDLTAVQYEYNNYNGKIKKITYSGGYSERYVYDHIDSITEIWYTVNGTETKAYEYKYTKKGQLTRENNQGRAETYFYMYDGCGNLILKSTHDYSTKIYFSKLHEKCIDYLGHNGCNIWSKLWFRTN